MKLLLNGHELEGVLAQGDTLGNALSAVQTDHVEENEVIAAIWIDGEVLTADRLAEWKDRPIEDFCEAKVEAPTRNTLAINGLRLMAEGIAQTGDLRNSITEGLGQGRSGEALQQLSTYLQTWDTAQQTIGSACRLLGLDFETMEVYGKQNGTDVQMVSDYIQRLVEQLQQIKSALEVGDLILLGDILEYEFGAITEQWQQMLEQLADRFEG